MSIQTDSTTGLERLGREVILILADQLNQEIVNQQAYWDVLDQELATTLGKNYAVTTIEPIPNDHLHLGHVPSLIDSQITDFPNVAVMAYQSNRGGDQALDQYHGLTDSIFIEVLCKAGPYPEDDQVAYFEGEEMVNRRTQRTTDAVVSVINSNRTLNGLVNAIADPPSVTIYDVFNRHLNRDRGPLYFWQGSRMVFTVQRLSRAF